MNNNKTHISWKSISIKALIAVVILLANFGITLANGETPATPPPQGDTGSQSGNGSARSQYQSFDVGTYLTVGGDTAYSKGEQDQKYLKSQNPVGAFILQAINLVALTAASLSFLAIVIAGFLMITAAGNENQLNKAKEILQRAIIGLVITLSAYFIISFVQNLLFETPGA